MGSIFSISWCNASHPGLVACYAVDTLYFSPGIEDGTQLACGTGSGHVVFGSLVAAILDSGLRSTVVMWLF